MSSLPTTTPDASQFEKKALTVLEQARSIQPIEDDDQYAEVDTWLSGLKAYQKEIKALFDEPIKKADEAADALRASKKRLYQPVADAEAIAKGILGVYQAKRRQEQEEAQRKADALAREQAAARKAAEIEALKKDGREALATALSTTPLVVPPAAKVSTELKGKTSFREDWTGDLDGVTEAEKDANLRKLVEAVAAKAAPLSLLKGNETEFRKFAQATKGQVPVPGLRFYTKTIAATRS